MAYWRLHYHLVWATHKREPMIDAQRERIIYGTLYSKANELGVIIHGAGNVEDHIHVVASIPSKISVSDCLRHFKGASSHAVNRMSDSQSVFKWQRGYGAFSVGERSLPDVIAYAKNQKQHHRDKTLIGIYEKFTDDEDSPSAQSA